MKKLLLTALLMMSFAATADTLSINWDVPTQNTDATPLNPADIEGYTLVYSLDGVDQAPIDIAVATSQEIAVSAGQYNFQMATKAYGLIGPYSDVLVVDVAEITKPNPPNFTITITCDATCTFEVR